MTETYTPRVENTQKQAQTLKELELRKEIAKIEKDKSLNELITAKINLRLQMQDLMQNSPEVYQQIQAEKEAQQLAEEQAEQARRREWQDNIARLEAMQAQRRATRQPSNVADIRDYRKMDFNTAQGSSNALGEAMERTSATFNREPETNETQAPQQTIMEKIAALKSKYFGEQPEQQPQTADLSVSGSPYGSVSLGGSIPYTNSQPQGGSYAMGNTTFSYQAENTAQAQ